MAGTNIKIIKEAFKEFNAYIDHEILRETELLAQNIIYRAIEYRKKAPGKHDYTGNLLNSIVSAVYKDKEFKKAFLSAETGIRQPRMYEMTASHNNGRYHIKVDYEGQTSNYVAEVETMRRKGIDDAEEFLSTYVPDINGYVIVVAYTTDYADWVENKRATTGFLSTFRYADKVATRLYPIKK